MSSPAHRRSFRSVAIAVFVCLMTAVVYQQAGGSQTVDDAQRLRQQAVVHLNSGRFAEGVGVADQAASLYESFRGNSDAGLADYLSTLDSFGFAPATTPGRRGVRTGASASRSAPRRQMNEPSRSR